MREPTTSHEHILIGGWEYGGSTYRDCACGAVFLSVRGVLIQALGFGEGHREYYRQLALDNNITG